MAQQAIGLVNQLTWAGEQAAAAQQDALLAQQQAADTIAANEQMVADYTAQANALLAQQQAAYEQQRQQQQAAAAMRQTSDFGQPARDPYMDEVYAELKNEPYLRNGHDVMSGNQATMWATQNRDAAIAAVARRNNWTDSQIQAVKKKFETEHGSLFKKAETGLLADIGDLANDAVEGFGFDLVGGALQLGVTSAAMAAEKMGLNGAESWAKSFNDAVDSGRAAWTSMASDKHKDQEAAVEQAQGAIETMSAVAENPAWLLGAAANMLGSGVGVGAAGRGAMFGVKTVLGTGGKVASKAATPVAADLANAANASMLARAGNWIAPAASKGAVFSPRSFMVAEGAGAFNDVLRQDGAFNEETGLYSTDATMAAYAGGAAAAGITRLGLGRGTVEDVLAGFGKRGDLFENGSRAAVDKVVDMLKTGATKEATQEAIDAAHTALLSHAGRELLEKAAVTPERKALMAVLLGGGGKVTGTANKMLRGGAIEGMEEAAVALVAGMAAQGIGDDGNWSLSNIDGDRLMNSIVKAGVLGATMGSAFAIPKMAAESKQNRAIIADYNSQVRTLDEAATTLAAQPVEVVAPAAPVAVDPLAAPLPMELDDNMIMRRETVPSAADLGASVDVNGIADNVRDVVDLVTPTAAQPIDVNGIADQVRAAVDNAMPSADAAVDINGIADQVRAAVDNVMPNDAAAINIKAIADNIRTVAAALVETDAPASVIRDVSDAAEAYTAAANIASTQGRANLTPEQQAMIKAAVAQQLGLFADQADDLNAEVSKYVGAMPIPTAAAEAAQIDPLAAPDKTSQTTRRKGKLKTALPIEDVAVADVTQKRPVSTADIKVTPRDKTALAVSAIEKTFGTTTGSHAATALRSHTPNGRKVVAAALDVINTYGMSVDEAVQYALNTVGPRAHEASKYDNDRDQFAARVREAVVAVLNEQSSRGKEQADDAAKKLADDLIRSSGDNKAEAEQRVVEAQRKNGKRKSAKSADQIQAEFDEELERTPRYSRFDDSRFIIDDTLFDTPNTADLGLDFEPDIYFDNHWDSMAYGEQTVQTQAATRDKYDGWIRAFFGADTADNVVYVSPYSLKEAEREANGFTLRTDPDRIYIVLHPGRTMPQVLWTVAHEQLHNGMTVWANGRIAAKYGEYKAQLEKLAENKTVQEIMTAVATRYDNISRPRLIEEALAEIRAAQATKEYAEFEARWGVKLPVSLRTSAPSSVIGKVVSWIRSFLSKLGVLSARVTDQDVNDFLRDVTNFYRDHDRAMGVTNDAAAFADRMSFDKFTLRQAHYYALARQTHGNFDALTPEQQFYILSRLAWADSDQQSMTEFDVAFDKGGRRKRKKSADDVEGVAFKHNDPVVDAAAERATERLAERRRERAAQVRRQNPDDPNDAGTILREVVQSIVLYPTRSGRSEFDAAATDYPVGMMSFVGADNVLSIVINDEVNGIKFNHEIPVRSLSGGMLDFAGTLAEARAVVEQRFPGLYQQRSGSATARELWGDRKPMTLQRQAIMNRVTREMVQTPNLRKVVNHFRQYIPDNWLPAVDNFLDYMFNMYTYWVDNMAIGRGLNRAYNELTGTDEDIIAQMLTDQNAADAYLARTTEYYQDGTGFKQHWRTMSYQDGMRSVYDMIRESGMSEAQITRDLYAIQEALSYQELLVKYGTKVDGKLILKDPSALGVAAREHATGFRFKDRDTTDLTVGAADPGAQRWLADFKQRPADEQRAVGKVVAALSAVNRAVVMQEQAHGVLDRETARDRMRRGIGNPNGSDYPDLDLRKLFPELDAEGYRFGGFYLSMKDADSNPFSTRETKGRTSTVKDPLKKTQEVLIARIRNAHANKEMANFARMMIEMPNEHFSVSPAVPQLAEDGEQVGWESTDKEAKAAMPITVDGHTVMLVAKTKYAKRMISPKRASQFIHTVGTVNHFFNAFKTTYSLSYIPVGMVRDVMTGYLNVSGAIGEKYVNAEDAPSVGFNMIRHALASMPNTFSATFKESGASPWLEVFQEVGAGMFFGDNFNSGAMRGELVSQFSQNPLVQTGKRVRDAIGYTPETAMRLGAFRAYLEHLHPNLASDNVTAADIRRALNDPSRRAERAAVIQGTKNITTNFQQHGEDNMVRYLFSFFNAVVQGSFVTLPQILSTQHGRKSAGMLLFASLIAAVYGIAGEDEDEFGNSKYYQSVNRHRALILGDTAIPVPDELGLPRSIVENIAGILMGKRDIGAAVVDVSGAAMDMVSPNNMGDTGNTATDVMYAFVPSLAQGFIGLSTGKDIFGRPLLANSAYGPDGKRVTNAADVERSTGRATAAGKELAMFLYGATGGGIDVSGDEVDYLMRQYLGGVYNLFTRGQTNSMLGEDAAMFLPNQAAAEAVRGFKNVRISKDTDKTWEDIREKVGISLRNAGTRLDVLNAEENQHVSDMAAIISAADKEMRQVRTAQGRTLKQVSDEIELAEKSNRWSDVRDLRADRVTLFEAQDEVKAEAIRDMIAKGYL